MNFSFQDCQITGMLAVMPHKEVLFEDEIKNYTFPERDSRQLGKLFGLNTRRIADDGVTAADLCIHGLTYLFEQKLLFKEEITAIVFVSQSPDYIKPPTSNVIQGKLNLGHDIICLDINQGCAGFVLGLFESFCLLNPIGERGKVILLNADTPSKFVSKRDRSIAPLAGDAAVITVIEKNKIPTTSLIKIKNDGSRYDAIMMPAGGARLPTTEKTLVEELQSDGNYRSMNQSFMHGADVFTFTLNDAVDLINEMIAESGFKKDEIDYCMLHQPNQYILKNMRRKITIEAEKVPINIVSLFGNSGGAALPVNIVYNLSGILTGKTLKLILGGFGIGLAWNAAALEMGKLTFCKMIDFKNGVK